MARAKKADLLIVKVAFPIILRTGRLTFCGAVMMDLQRQKLRAKKSWFYFDDEFVALGAGITNSSDNPVVTTVNQSLLRGEVRVSNQVAPLPVGQQ